MIRIQDRVIVPMENQLSYLRPYLHKHAFGLPIDKRLINGCEGLQLSCM